MTPIRSSKLSPSVESLRSFRPRPTETSSGSATSHSIVNAIWSSASSICSSTSAPSPHVTTSLREIRRGAVGCRYNPPQLNTGPSSTICYFDNGKDPSHPSPCLESYAREQPSFNLILVEQLPQPFLNAGRSVF